LDQAVDLLTKSWNTTKVEMPDELEAPFMKLIRLPLMKNFIVNDDKYSENVSINLMKTIQDKYNVITCVVYIQAQLCIRISCFPYNDLSDYIALKNAILDINKD
jgi:hypothetical protein